VKHCGSTHRTFSEYLKDFVRVGEAPHLWHLPTRRRDKASVNKCCRALLRIAEQKEVRTGGKADYSRLLAERFALAREVFGGEIDLTAGSVLRKLLELTSLEDARTWAALSRAYDDGFVTTATGAALSRLGEELGLPRPHLEATGVVTLELVGSLPAGVTELVVPRGARMLTPGGHHAWLTGAVTLSATANEVVVPVAAFHPGPDGDLDPGAGAEFTLDRFHPEDDRLAPLRELEASAGATLVTISHDQPLEGGTTRWPDERYRRLLLRAPRSVWTTDAIRIAASLVAGVRRVEVRDAWGGLDLHQSIFGNFNFAERLFASERDIARPYYLTVLVGPTPGAMWHGADGLHAAVASAIEDVRPVSIFPFIQRAQLVSVSVEAELVVDGLPLPAGSAARDAAPTAPRLPPAWRGPRSCPGIRRPSRTAPPRRSPRGHWKPVGRRESGPVPVTVSLWTAPQGRRRTLMGFVSGTWSGRGQQGSGTDSPTKTTLVWRKSRHSSHASGGCLEAAVTPGRVLVRDSRNPDLGHLAFPAREWQALLQAALHDGI
jgi:hypothetical protein